MESEYVIQVVDRATRRVVQWAPGLSVERQLVSDLCGRVEAKGVGIGRTSRRVVQIVRSQLLELLHDLKSDVQPK